MGNHNKYNIVNLLSPSCLQEITNNVGLTFRGGDTYIVVYNLVVIKTIGIGDTNHHTYCIVSEFNW